MNVSSVWTSVKRVFIELRFTQRCGPASGGGDGASLDSACLRWSLCWVGRGPRGPVTAYVGFCVEVMTLIQGVYSSIQDHTTLEIFIGLEKLGDGVAFGRLKCIRVPISHGKIKGAHMRRKLWIFNDAFTSLI